MAATGRSVTGKAPRLLFHSESGAAQSIGSSPESQQPTYRDKPTYREMNVNCQTGRRKTAAEEVTDMIFLSKWSSKTLCAGAELGVFDCLSRDGTRTASDVAADIGLDATLLYRLLRALASLGLLTETSGRQFNLTEHGTLLRTDAPGSLR
jgi:Dimerisation domain